LGLFRSAFCSGVIFSDTYTIGPVILPFFPKAVVIAFTKREPLINTYHPQSGKNQAGGTE
jgi:hypothetical protein